MEGAHTTLIHGLRRYTLLLAALTAGACDGVPVDTRVPQWRAVEDLRFTSVALANVADIEAGLSGTMYVLPEDQPHVLVYRPEANGLVNTMTQGVTGPLVKASAVGSAGGLLWIFDDASQIAHLYQGSGAPVVINDLMVQAPKPQNGELRFDGILRDASVIARIWPAAATAADRVLIVRITPTLLAIDTIAITRPTATVLISALDQMIVIVDDEDEAPGDSTGFRFTKLNLVGDTVYSTPWYYRAAQRRARGKGPTAPRHYSGATIATNGSIYIGTGDPLRGRTRWWVFGIVGRSTAYFDLPQYVRLHAAGTDRAYGHHSRDEAVLRYVLVQN